MNVHSLTHQTTITVQVVVQDESNAFLFSLLLVTKLFWYVFRWCQIAVQIKNEIAAVIVDVIASVDFTCKGLAIGFKSLAYGLGLSV
ncbi:MAG: hypothetical protein AAF629_30230 [Chloroflexota bacterium]